MEHRLTEIPVNCILEFLNPDVFFNWREKHDLLKKIQKQNEGTEYKLAKKKVARIVPGVLLITCGCILILLFVMFNLIL